jgi:hypothetical protein
LNYKLVKNNNTMKLFLISISVVLVSYFKADAQFNSAGSGTYNWTDVLCWGTPITAATYTHNFVLVNSCGCSTPNCAYSQTTATTTQPIPPSYCAGGTYTYTGYVTNPGSTLAYDHHFTMFNPNCGCSSGCSLTSTTATSSQPSNPFDFCASSGTNSTFSYTGYSTRIVCSSGPLIVGGATGGPAYVIKTTTTLDNNFQVNKLQFIGGKVIFSGTNKLTFGTGTGYTSSYNCYQRY